MIKKIIPVILCLILAFSICVSAENTSGDTKENTPTITEQNPASTEQSSAPAEGMLPQGGRGGGPGGGRMGGGMPPDAANEQFPQNDNTEPSGQNAMNGNFQPGNDMQNQNVQTKSSQTENSDSLLAIIKEYSTPITSLVLLVFAFVFVIFYKRKLY